MKSVKQIAFAALLTLGAFGAVTMTSCNKNDDTTCAVGYEGSDCKTEVRTNYAGTYTGSGYDSDGGTYTNWGLVFAASGTDATAMTMNLVDENNSPQLLFTVTLKTNTTFTVDSKTSGTYTYSGTGTISTSAATLSLTETDNSTGTAVTTIYTFSNMVK